MGSRDSGKALGVREAGFTRSGTPLSPWSDSGEEGKGGSHLRGASLWLWQPLPSFQQLCEPQHGHLPLGEAYELDEFLQKKQEQLFFKR